MVERDEAKNLLSRLSKGVPILVDDHQAVELYMEDGLLRRVLVCCDCGLVHLMSIDAGARRAYFVRDDGPISEGIRSSGRAAGHTFPREGLDIDADHEWALWCEKWKAALDLMSGHAERAEAAKAENAKLHRNIDLLLADLEAAEAQVRELRAEGDAANDILRGDFEVNLESPIVQQSELCQNALKAVAQVQELRETLGSLTMSLKAIFDSLSYRAVFTVAYAHGQKYTGPDCSAELSTAEALLARTEPEA